MLYEYLAFYILNYQCISDLSTQIDGKLETIIYFYFMKDDDDPPRRKKYRRKELPKEQIDHYSKIQEQNTSELMKSMSKTLQEAEKASQLINSYKPPQPLEKRYQVDRYQNDYSKNNNRNQWSKTSKYTEKSEWEEGRRNNNTYRSRGRGGYKNNNYNDNQKGHKSDPWQYLLKDSIQIEKDGFGLEDKIKKLKKIFKQEFKQAKKVKILASNTYPMILFQYKDQNSNIHHLHLRQAIKKIKAFKEKRQLFEVIFQRVFKPVPQKYYKMIVFGIQKGKMHHVNITKNNIMNTEDGSSAMFFYIRKKSVINFTIFDRYLRSVQFSSEFVQNFKDEHPQQYDNFKKFYKSIFATERQVDVVDVFNNQEISSDQDTHVDFQQMPIYQIRQKVFRIINKNIDELDKLIEEKEEIMNTEAQKDVQSDKFKKISEQYEDLSENRDNFVNARNEVAENIQKYPKEEKQFYKICLKKLIIAEKQLQSKLPIVTKKRKIFQLLKKKNLLIIQGETGSGKSTQLPQMLCQFYGLFDNPKALPVLVTQPRRLATRSLAERVASEMEQKVGGFVDYVASSGKEPNEKARIIFKLDRIVLDQMTQDPLLSKYSCLVIDQAHERTISIDVILGFVKELLKKRNDFKVIVTSASMDIHLFERYFQTETLKVSGRTYPVSISYKDYTHFKDGDKNQMIRKICKAIDEEVLYDNSKMKTQFKGHLLCFCSSLDQINELVKIYENKLNKNVFSVFALHGKITPADQKKVFQDVGRYKFIFASRIAETAITIDGVRVVIDPGLDIELVYDQKYKVSSMKLQEITQSSAKQRAGRSGRTGPGHCIRLYSEDNFKKRNQNKMPQIKNSSLQTVVLRLKSLKIEDVIGFPYIQKPDAQGLTRSVQILTLIGALDNKSEEITKIGQLLVRLPIEPFLSRAIIQAIIFDQTLKKAKNLKKLPQDQLLLAKQRGITVTVVQILSLIINFSNLFFVKKEQRQQGQKTKYDKFSDQDGDFFFLDNIFRKYKQLKDKLNANYSKGSKSRQKEDYRQINHWVRQHYLNYRALNQVTDLINQIDKILQKYNINQKDYQDQFDQVKAKLEHCKSFKQIVLSSLITSFSANLCKFSGNLNIGYTIVNQRRPIQIYGTSILSLLGIQADWIICYDLYTNQQGILYCKLAHKVDYEFMKDHIDSYISKQFKIKQIQQKNPFYTQIHRTLPTKLVQQIKFDYFKSNHDNYYSFLQQSFPVINQDLNKVSFFVISGEKDDPKQKHTIIQGIKQKLDAYIQSLQIQTAKPLRHNYIGNIFILFKDGFQINAVEFTNKQFLVEVSCHCNIAFIIESDSRSWGTCQVQDLIAQNKQKNRANIERKLVFVPNMKKLKIYILQQQNKNDFIEYLNVLKINLPNTDINFKESLVDKRRKIPQTKILMHYFAGKCEKDNILLSYSSYPLNQIGQSIAQSQLLLIKKGLQKKRGHKLLSSRYLNLTKKGDGINCYQCPYDEYQITQQLYEMDKNQLLTYAFKFPSYLKKFRQPQISQARKTDDQWRQQIFKLLEAVDAKKQNTVINIFGRYHRGKPGQKMSQFEKRLRVDMSVILTTLDTTIYPKLKNKYDGKNGIIGCQKLHIRAVYQQVIVITSQKVFEALQQQYCQYIQDYKIQFPLLAIQVIYRQSRNKNTCIIKARSSKKDDFIIPQRVISELFSPKLIKLEYSEFRFLNNLDEGNEILNNLQEEYKWKIYFGMVKGSNYLKVYCDQTQLKNIQQKLKAEIAKFKYYTEDISYKGKNLNKVKEVLQKMLQNITPDCYLSFDIIFQYRKIAVVADLATFQNVKNQIAKLTNSSKAQCDICTDIMKNPFKLINCECTFCWLCITDHIRCFRNSPDQQIIQCPNGNCCKPINMNDVRTLITEEQFQKICDIKISRFIQKSKGLYLQCKFCQNIFSKSEVEQAGEINCEACGKIQCIKCNQSHPNYTCDQWKDKDNIQKHMKNLGVKQCPGCKTGIQKNGGCNHVQCTNCKAHICWKCLKQFKQSGKCYDHLAKQCGGIFDVDAR